MTSVFICKLCIIINENPDCAKSLFEDLTTAALDLVDDVKFIHEINQRQQLIHYSPVIGLKCAINNTKDPTQIDIMYQ